MENKSRSVRHPGWLGFVFGGLILLLWVMGLYLLLPGVRPTPLLAVAGLLGMTFLYTGLFITAHDAMHGLLAPHPRWNAALGTLCALLFAWNYYPLLLRKHHAHHRHVATGEDPDFHKGGFFVWYFSFLRAYLTWPQLLLMALTFQGLTLYYDSYRVVLFWMLPSLLSTLQLFYFGTYLPHRGHFPAENVHHARSQRRNHLWAFISCYFFGYHWEHHQYPYVPWWRLWQVVR